MVIHNMEDENIFDKDDEALDYILYKESETERNEKPNNNGCLALVFIIVAPIATLVFSFHISYIAL